MGIAGSAAIGTGPAELTWRGHALGAEAKVTFANLDRARAQLALRELLQEVERLENIFSLYRPNSELSRLNRDRVLSHPSQDFRALLAASLNYWQGTGGAFNPAVQPLWEYLARHFAATSNPPCRHDLHRLAQACNPADIEIRLSQIRLKAGMALTFNGIAQGYITDRAVQILNRHGIGQTLVNFGEFHALPGKPWRLQMGQTRRLLPLENAAMAVSAGNGTRFSADGRWHHLIDPATGTSCNTLRTVTVIAETAIEADALATAFYVAPAERRAAIVRRYPGCTIFPEA
jgi:thiamine biosynthesis lipoprotein